MAERVVRRIKRRVPKTYLPRKRGNVEHIARAEMIDFLGVRGSAGASRVFPVGYNRRPTESGLSFQLRGRRLISKVTATLLMAGNS